MRCRYVRNGQCNNRATDEMWCADHAQRGKIAAAERAVVKTGLAWWRSGYDDPQKGEEFDAACAALAALEAK